jgi:serine/threonine-protein kinase
LQNNSLNDRLRTTLGASYTLERELGGGGMSRVFLARDETLERAVVVKVLSPDLAAGVSAERFTREIKLAAGLQQANIVPLLSAGETEGLPYYTMPFVDGLSLRARLERNGALPAGEAISVLRDVARALAYAHEHGVVHRDIKPENILLSGDAAVVTDFGIAKALAASKTQAPGGTLTQVGTSIGTPAYMAPEQAAGDPATDHRADLYALGCVAYEMLTGAAPFAGRPVHQLYAAHLTETPAPVEKARADAPRALAALVMRCLEKDPAKRPQNARELLAALDGIGPTNVSGVGASSRRPRAVLGAAAAAVVVAGALGLWAVRSRPASGSPAAQGAAGSDAANRSVAVLPFENQGDSADAYFADGITDAIRGKLTAVPGLTVIARSSSVSYRSAGKPPQAIARELGVRYLLTGTVRFAGTSAERRVQVSPELVEIADGRAPESRWQQPFDAAVKDVFGVQNDIAGRVATAMQGALGSNGHANLNEAITSNPAAYDAYLRAEALRYVASAESRSLRRALAAYEEALRHDSTMARAWAGAAVTSTNLYSNGVPSAALARSALAAAERAIALDSGAWQGHYALAAYHRAVSRDVVRAMAAATRARQVAPQEVDPRGLVASIKSDLGELDAAEREYAEALRLDPRSARLWTRQFTLLLRLGRVAEAREAANRVLALNPAVVNSVLYRVLVEAAAGDVPAAREVIARATRDIPRESLVAFLGNAYDLGWLLDDDAQRLLLTLGPDAFDGDRATMAIVRAQIYGWRGDSAAAQAWGDTAARVFASQLRDTPDQPQRNVLRGLALAYAGRSREAFAQVERGLALQGPTAEARQSSTYAYVVYVAARAALLAGDRDRALAWLAESRRSRYFATPAWLRVEPTWAPLRRDPRFAALTAESTAAR